MVIFDSIENAFPAAAEIAVIDEGCESVYAAQSDRFDEIIAVWTATLADCRPMPAFGVSLNDLTVKDMEHGLWLEFRFAERCNCGGMDFERLAIKAEANFSGFNVVRYNSVDGYAGRCYYIDLARGKNLSEVCRVLLEK